MSAVPMLETRALCSGYGQAQILFDVSLHVAPGEVVALVGRNGAGKSTTLKTIMGLVPKWSGEIAFTAREIGGQSPDFIARLGLGYVPEERRIFTDLTVDENLEVGRRTRPDRAARFSREILLEIFPNLAEMRSRRASAMSGGEQQMLTIARTLMGNPDAILLDEPSEGLAPIIVEQMTLAIGRMKSTGLSILLSEQNLRFAGALADRAYIIEKGAIRHEAPMRDLLNDRALLASYLAV